MARLIVTDFVTLDGVIEAPGFDEHRSGRNAWALRLTDDDMQRYNVDQLPGAAALLLGRTTYQIWAAFWPSLPDDEPFGRRTNEIAEIRRVEHVDERDLDEYDDHPGRPGRRDRGLKDQIDGDILCYGSADLVGGLMDADLVDEYRLCSFRSSSAAASGSSATRPTPAISGSSAPGPSDPERSTSSTSRNGIRPPASTRIPTRGRPSRSSRSMPRRTPTGCSRP